MITSAGQTWEISIIGLSLSIFTLIAIGTKSNKQKSDHLLILWLIVLSIPLLLAALAYLGIKFKLLAQVTNPSITLLQAPILYAYVNSLIKKQQKEFQFSALLHLAPFLFFYALFFTTPKLSPLFSMVEHTHNMHKSLDFIELSRRVLRHFASINIAIFIFYSVITVASLIKHQKKIGAFFSKKDNQIALYWIYLFPALFITLLLLNIVNESPLWRFPPIEPLTLHLLSYLFSIILLCLFAVKQKPIFEQHKQPSPPISIETLTAPQTASPLTGVTIIDKKPSINLESKEMQEITIKMQGYMQSDKPYLNAEFSVYQLAEALNIPRRTLSYVLNNALNKNFFQYVNEYRIQEVKTYLTNSENKSTILELALQSGFNSKSSFNNLFKKYCAMTPSQYRRLNRKCHVQK